MTYIDGDRAKTSTASEDKGGHREPLTEMLTVLPIKGKTEDDITMVTGIQGESGKKQIVGKD